MSFFPETLRFDTQLYGSPKKKKMALFLPGIEDNTHQPPAPGPSLEMARHCPECGPDLPFKLEFCYTEKHYITITLCFSFDAQGTRRSVDPHQLQAISR